MCTFVGQDLPGKMDAGLSDVSFMITFYEQTYAFQDFLYALRVRKTLITKAFNDFKSLKRAAHEI